MMMCDALRAAPSSMRPEMKAMDWEIAFEHWILERYRSLKPLDQSGGGGAGADAQPRGASRVGGGSSRRSRAPLAEKATARTVGRGSAGSNAVAHNKLNTVAVSKGHIRKGGGKRSSRGKGALADARALMDAWLIDEIDGTVDAELCTSLVEGEEARESEAGVSGDASDERIVSPIEPGAIVRLERVQSEGSDTGSICMPLPRSPEC